MRIIALLLSITTTLARADSKVSVALADCERGVASRCMDAASDMSSARRSTHLRRRGAELIADQCAGGSAQACLRHGQMVLASDAEQAIDDLDRGCELGSGEACLLLGEHYAAGKLVRKDTKRALVMFDRACSSGIGRGCDALADRLAAGAGGDTGRYRRHIAALHRTACSGDDRSGCAHSGEQRLADHDRDAAYGDFWKACELGDAKSCYQAGVLATKPNGARLLFLRACDAHLGKGCAQLADMFASGRGGERNWRQAIMYAEKACSLEGVSPCTRALALKQQSPDWHCANDKACERLCAEGIARSCRRLAELRDDEPATYERGCMARDAQSCTRRGHAATTLEVGAKWYARGCAAGDRSACAYRDFVDADEGSSQAVDLLRKRCKTDRDACVLFGLAIVDDQTVEAQRLWKNACDRKHGIACRLLAEEFGGSKALMKRACSAGDGVACDDLSLFAPPRRATAPAWL